APGLLTTTDALSFLTYSTSLQRRARFGGGAVSKQAAPDIVGVISGSPARSILSTQSRDSRVLVTVPSESVPIERSGHSTRSRRKIESCWKRAKNASKDASGIGQAAPAVPARSTTINKNAARTKRMGGPLLPRFGNLTMTYARYPSTVATVGLNISHGF